MTGKAIDSIQRNKQVLKRINLKKIRGREKSIFTSELNKSKLRLIIKKKVQKSSSTLLGQFPMLPRRMPILQH